MIAHLARVATTPAILKPRPVPEAIVIWDIENVRLPISSLSPATVVSAINKKLLDGYLCTDFVCCVTPRSLKQIERTNPTFLKEIVPTVDVRLASGKCNKLGSDYVLKRSLNAFIDMGAHRFGNQPLSALGDPCKIILITGDSDFLDCAQRALDYGFIVQLVHYGPICSKVLLNQKYSINPIEWTQFLSEINNGTIPKLPYETNEEKAVRLNKTYQDPAETITPIIETTEELTRPQKASQNFEKINTSTASKITQKIKTYLCCAGPPYADNSEEDSD